MIAGCRDLPLSDGWIRIEDAVFQGDRGGFLDEDRVVTITFDVRLTDPGR